MELTPHQHTVASHQNGHALCIAVAGSGKTTTLAHLIKNLLTSGADARRMMVMMFNKSAQLDFSDKLDRLVRQSLPAETLSPEVRTYHSTGLRLLKSLENWGLRTPCERQPMGDKETELLIKDLIFQFAPGSMKDRLKSDTAKYIESAIQFIDSVKAFLTTPEQYFRDNDYPDEFRFYQQVFYAFEQWRHQHRRITFTDMLYDPVCLIEQHPEILPRVTNKMDYIIVDEYQDTSTLQHRFTQIIAGDRARVVAVGDPDQTIYEFAGANIDNILHHFENDFGQQADVDQLTLPHTFRYGHSIAMAASHLIARNRARKNVICQAHHDNAPSNIEVTQSQDETDSLIKALINHLQQPAPEALAILVRVWAQAVPIELSLLERGIPYRHDGPSLFERPEIDALMAALELNSGQFHFMSIDQRQKRLQRLLTLPHIGLKTHLTEQLVNNLKRLEEGYGKALSLYSEHITGISDYQRKKLAIRGKVWSYLEKSGDSETTVRLLNNYIIQTELRESLQSMSLNDQRTEEQLLAIDGLLAYIRQFNASPSECYQHIVSLKQKNRERSRSRSDNQLITLSSSHRAKGLEWPVVFIPGLTGRYWPFVREDDLAGPTANDLEAERRLLYVAMTRARKTLHLFTCPGDINTLSSNWAQDKKVTPSRFLAEMALPAAQTFSRHLHENDNASLIKAMEQTGLTRQSRLYLEAVRPELAEAIARIPSRKDILSQQKKQSYNKARSHPARQAVLSSLNQTGMISDNEPWQPDARVRHSIFGVGKVIEVNDSNFVILFDSQHGVKRFARTEQVRHLFEKA
ncbi:ATP-dependent helicase [Endozoicomonas lisbonensis]|uniref:DNA 3'-5' helicase n=1 Tax=Endozoicomonas lisbonensis TaxID=3120522 RepID=A0ABV2SBS2_9GAMM